MALARFPDQLHIRGLSALLHLPIRDSEVTSTAQLNSRTSQLCFSPCKSPSLPTTPTRTVEQRDSDKNYSKFKSRVGRSTQVCGIRQSSHHVHAYRGQQDNSQRAGEPPTPNKDTRNTSAASLIPNDSGLREVLCDVRSF